MTNRPKNRGTAAETAALRWLREHGFPWTERLALAGSADCGDLSLLPGRGVVVEVKNVAVAGTGQPPAGLLADWMAQTEAERANSDAEHAALVVKRAGTTDVGRWWCYVPLGHLIRLERGLPADVGEHSVTQLWGEPYGEPVCITVATWTVMLRKTGWGSPVDDESEAA